MAFKWFKKKKHDAEAASESEEILSEEASEEGASVEGVSEDAEPIEEASRAPAEAKEIPPESDPETVEAAAPVETEEKEGEVAAEASSAAAGGGFFGRLKRGLAKTRDILTTDIEDLFQGAEGVTDEMLEELEELLITADLGVQTSLDLVEKITKRAH